MPVEHPLRDDRVESLTLLRRAFGVREGAAPIGTRSSAEAGEPAGVGRFTAGEVDVVDEGSVAHA